eukprot:CAMPEP_0185157880 /NCGR_PEP_ID=MMETSP1139-20130426/2060_1 /TAXON_ID=298111 /ORGANISM="Pavlova sp., Strain CCMP459" /LENGTH=40 /DNA_ID= /DNA_START= /DNA_END= /DNA_ORIENTATION=
MSRARTLLQSRTPLSTLAAALPRTATPLTSSAMATACSTS